MRSRGAGARSIAANFGFVFHAGPVQLSDDTAPSVTPSCPPPIQSTCAVKEKPKRKRIVRQEEEEDDDQVWFSKRSKKQPILKHSPVAATPSQVPSVGPSIPLAVDSKQPKPRAKRKRITVAKPRQERPVKSTVQDALILEHHPNPADPPCQEGEDELSNQSLQQTLTSIPTNECNKYTKTRKRKVVNPSTDKPDMHPPIYKENTATQSSSNLTPTEQQDPPPAVKKKVKVTRRIRVIRVEKKNKVENNDKDTITDIHNTLPRPRPQKERLPLKERSPNSSPQKTRMAAVDKDKNKDKQPETLVLQQDAKVIKPSRTKVKDATRTRTTTTKETTVKTEQALLLETSTTTNSLKKQQQQQQQAPTKKRRIFTIQDSELDLDAMLNDIAAIAGEKKKRNLPKE
jgi:hypothetical protein